MVFSKSFPKRTDKSIYPRWNEVFLTEEEEKQVEEACRHENIILMQECIEDARKVLSEESLKDYQSDLVNMAIALFEKRASHAIYWKENLAKEKSLDLEEEKQQD